jgi:high-affinity iron transporter
MMLGALIIVFREAIEAGLIVGIVLAVTRGLAHARTYVFAGVCAGAGGAALVALFADALSKSFSGNGQELFNAGILALAVIMLAWHNIWMSRHGRELSQQLSSVGRAVANGERTLFALASVVGLAILREGSEVALFLYGVVASGETGYDVFLGGLLGLALGAAVSFATFYGLVKIPPRHLFFVTSWLITFLAAGLAAQSAAFLQQAGVVTLFAETLWDTSWALSDKTILGRVLHTLIGYSDQPSLLQGLVYLSTLILIYAATKFTQLRPRLEPRLSP